MNRNIEVVHIDGLVLLKIIKHCEDEIVQPEDVASGVLLGMSANNILEVTHSFPSLLPEDVDNENEAENNFIASYPTKMIRQLRDSNIDYMEIGFYQSSCSGAFLNRVSLENLYQYHCNLSESIMLVYDPSKASRGQISLQAFQLTDELKTILAGCNFDNSDVKLDAAKLASLNTRNMWKEIPIVIKNSHLVNCMVGTLNAKLRTDVAKYETLDLNVGNDLETHTKSLMENLDTLTQHLQALIAYKKMAHRNNKNNQHLPALPDKLDSTLLITEILQYSQDLSEISEQTLSKLSLAKGLHWSVEKEK